MGAVSIRETTGKKDVKYLTLCIKVGDYVVAVDYRKKEYDVRSPSQENEYSEGGYVTVYSNNTDVTNHVYMWKKQYNEYMPNFRAFRFEQLSYVIEVVGAYNKFCKKGE